MKYQDEYRDPDAVRTLLDALERACTKPHRIMEVCGGQTHAFLRFGLEERLPERLTLLHGPGCPVCVTPVGFIDLAVALARRPDVILATFGDMLRVPGSHMDLQRARAEGADVRMVYSPLDALRLARLNPERQIVFFGVGFETTAPAVALCAFQAQQLQVPNFSLLLAHVLVPPAIAALLESPEQSIDGFLAAGHVCTVMGLAEYHALAARYHVPIVVTGFEPVELLEGLLRCVIQLEAGVSTVENAYTRVVQEAGNPHAQALMREVFAVTDRSWRGLGVIPSSGLALSAAYQHLNASTRFGVTISIGQENMACQSGLVLQGRLKPMECPAFGTTCTPEHPLGATMVSSEGACAAWYRYRRSMAPDDSPPAE